MRKLREIEVIVFVLAILSLFTSSYALGNSDLKQDSISSQGTHEVIVYPEVVEQLKRSREAFVIVMLKDNSGLSYSITKSKEENYKILEQKKKYFNQVQSAVISTLSESDFHVKTVFASTNGFAGSLTNAGLDKLKQNRNVASIHPDRDYKALLSESRSLIDVGYVWGLGYTGTGETICLIDTGVDYTHPDLGECFGPGCKVVGGYNFCETSDCSIGNSDPIDENGHGTNTAGIIAADGDIVGVAPDSQIVALKASFGNGITFRESTVVQAVNWCLDNRTTFNISIISMSLGSSEIFTEPNCDPTDPLHQTVNDAHGMGLFISAASGNNANLNGIASPACARGATSVGAVYDADVGARTWPACSFVDTSTGPDKLVCLTNRDENLDLLAPGAMITTTKLGGGSYTDGGTSYAAPHVAGVAALLLEAYPTLTPDEIEQLLKDTGDPVFDDRIPGTGLIFPRVNARSALLSLAIFKQVAITNTGTLPLLVYNITGNESWISASPPLFDLDSNESLNVTVQVNPEGLPVGNYTGNLFIYSNDPDENPKTIPITLEVNEIFIAAGDNDGPGIPTNVTCNNTFCNSAFHDSINLECSGSIDPEEDTITYSFEAYYQHINQSNAFWHAIGSHPENSTLTWNITDIPEQSGVDLRCRAIDVGASYTYSDYYDPPINLTISPEPPFHTLSISLQQGWNLISIPFALPDPSLPSALSAIEGRYTIVYAYQNGERLSFDPRRPPAENTLTQLTPEYGYWIKMTDTAVMETQGSLSAQGTSIPLTSGWNLVGYPSLEEQSVEDAFAPIMSSLERVLTYDPADVGEEWKSYDPDKPPFLNTLTTMEPGVGYWVKTEEDVTWTVG